MKDERPSYDEVPLQPGETFLKEIGFDYWNTESAARRVAEKAEEEIDRLRALNAELVETLREANSVIPQAEWQALLAKAEAAK